MGTGTVIQGIARNVEWEERQDRQSSLQQQTGQTEESSISTSRGRSAGSNEAELFSMLGKRTEDSVSAGTSSGESTTRHWGKSTSDTRSKFATALTFRIERTDENGDALPPVSVRIIDEEATSWEDSRLHRNLVSGDQVRVAGVYDERNILVPSIIFNLRAGVYVLGSAATDEYGLNKHLHSAAGYSTNHIAYLERNFLDQVPGKINEARQDFKVPNVDALSFVKIQGLSNFWKNQENGGAYLHTLIKDVIAGLYSHKESLIYLIVGENSRISLYMGSAPTSKTQDFLGVLESQAVSTKDKTRPVKAIRKQEETQTIAKPKEDERSNTIAPKIQETKPPVKVIPPRRSLPTRFILNLFVLAQFPLIIIGLTSEQYWLVLLGIFILLLYIAFGWRSKSGSAPPGKLIVVKNQEWEPFDTMAQTRQPVGTNTRASYGAKSLPAPEPVEAASAMQMLGPPQSGQQDGQWHAGNLETTHDDGRWSDNQDEFEEDDELVMEDGEATLLASLKGHYRDIEMTELSADDVLHLQEKLKSLPYVSVITGTPTVKAEPSATGLDQIERLIRGMQGTNWAYLVVTRSVQRRELRSLEKSVLKELKDITDTEQSAGVELPVAQKYKERLQKFSEKIDTGKKRGLWHVATYMLAGDSATLSKGKSIVQAVLGGADSQPDAIRTLDYGHHSDYIHRLAQITTPAPPSPGQIQYPHKFLSALNSNELTAMLHLPTEEVPGFFIRADAMFASDLSRKHLSEEAIAIGAVSKDGRLTGEQYRLELPDFCRHVLIAGTTGAGKTNSVFHLLRQFWSQDIPIPCLIIEPAKTEYRPLLHSELGADLQIFTLGDETTSPFRLNPFEIGPRVSVQTHIDNLNAVFNASFNWYGPTTYILARCINEIYRDKGWDLVNNDNVRGIHWCAQPTLTDLHRKVDEVVDFSPDYSEDLKKDIKGALKTRINSLREGGKGLMLDTSLSIPIGLLLQKPTVLELDKIGNDVDKAFVMGLLLTSLREYYQAHPLADRVALKHITVVEEAHRLLENVPRNTNLEVADPTGEMIKRFCDMLSEVRAYGEGLIIVEQIPNKLAPDVIKNTNLKLMHRIVAEDDRHVVGRTMNLDEQQERRLGTLETGQAVAYSEGDDSAMLLQVPHRKVAVQVDTKLEENQAIRAAMQRVVAQIPDVFAPLPGYLPRESANGTHKEAVRIAENREFVEIMARYILSVVISEAALFAEFPPLRQTINKFRTDNGANPDVVRFSLIYGVHHYFENHGRQYKAPYSAVDALKREFMPLILDVALRYEAGGEQPELTDDDRVRVRLFQQKYQTVFRCIEYPFAGCRKVCPAASCLYRYNVRPLLTDDRLDRNFRNALGELQGEDRWKKLDSICQATVRRVLTTGAPAGERRKAALCFAIQKSEAMEDIDFFIREDILQQLIDLK